MINQQLLDFIKQQSSLGKSREEIKKALLQTGWKEADIEEGFTAIANNTAVAPSAAPTALPGVGALFSQAWKLYKERFWVLIGTYLLPYLIIVGLVALLAAFGIVGVKFSAGTGAFLIILAIIAVILMVYVGLWAETALVVAVKDSTEKIGVMEAFKRSQHKIGGLFLVNLLTGLAALGGFILLIVPGIIFAIWFSVSSYVMIAEDIRGTKALSASKAYVAGRFGGVFWRWFCFGLVYFAFYFILGLILKGLPQSQDAAKAITQIITSIFSVLWAPFAAIYGYTLYQHLKASR